MLHCNFEQWPVETSSKALPFSLYVFLLMRWKITYQQFQVPYFELENQFEEMHSWSSRSQSWIRTDLVRIRILLFGRLNQTNEIMANVKCTQWDCCKTIKAFSQFSKELRKHIKCQGRVGSFKEKFAKIIQNFFSKGQIRIWIRIQIPDPVQLFQNRVRLGQKVPEPTGSGSTTQPDRF
jgi:hypothetical protein